MTHRCRRPDESSFVSIFAAERSGGDARDPGPEDLVKSSVNLPIPCSGLLLDTGDVLFDATAWWRWLVQLLSRLGLHAQFPTLYQVWKRHYLADVNSGRREYWGALRDLLRTAGLSDGQINEVLMAGQPKQRRFEESLRPLPGVKATLARLASMGIPMGVLSNAPYSSDCVAAGLKTLGIGSYFMTVLSSSDLGLSSQDGRCYRAAAEALRWSIKEIAFVGHDTEELAGAMRAGMRTIAFNYDQNASADVYLNHFEQLIQVVQLASWHQRAG